MIPTFTEWMKLMDESSEIPKGGWSKRTAVPVGISKDVQPDHPGNATDPEPNPEKYRGKIHIHVDSRDVSPGRLGGKKK